jgi:hypothetical protein
LFEGANVAEQLRNLKKCNMRLFVQGKKRINDVLAELEMEMIGLQIE